MEKKTKLIDPYGGILRTIPLATGEQKKIVEKIASLPSITISRRSECDLEMIATGAFSPLSAFMSRDEYLSVINTMRLPGGRLFPIPVTLPVDPVPNAGLDDEVVLRNQFNLPLAIMRIVEIYKWNRPEEEQLIYGTVDQRHPMVSEMRGWGKYYISGPIKMINFPEYADFLSIRLTPQQMRERLLQMSNPNVVAFQTRNPMHRAHEEIVKRAQSQIGGTLLLHPVVGLTKPGDVDYTSRVLIYKVLFRKYFSKKNTALGLLPLAMRMAGPKEALWHGIIRRNFGANYFIVGRDHAGPGTDSHGKNFYAPYAAQELFAQHERDIGVKLVAFDEMVYVPKWKRYEQFKSVPDGIETFSLSGTQVRDKYLATGKKLPSWFTRPEVGMILREIFPPKHRRGFCVWFTGLPCSGKTTIARIVASQIVENGRGVSYLDGDVIRTHLSKGLDFSKEGREDNLLRIGFVASEIVKHNGAVICAAVSPYESIRERVRKMIKENAFILVYVSTPVSVCEQRDAKGMYQKARLGKIKHFTGVDDPYETPVDPEITVDTVKGKTSDNAMKIIKYLKAKGYLKKTVGS